jgi:hypothetical protein
MKRVMKLISFAVCLFLLLGMGSAFAEDYTPVVREASFDAGGVVILDANVGDVRVLPTDKPGTLRLVITPHTDKDAQEARQWVREFSANGSQAKVVIHTPKTGNHSFDVSLYVPQRSDLRVSLGVGDLTIRGISGNADAEVGIGDLNVTVHNPKDYHSVAMSVRIGDVDASAFDLHPSGFLGKSVKGEFSAGSYRLKLHTGIGDVSCTAAGT